MTEKTPQKKKRIHVLTRILIFTILIAAIPLIISAISIRVFSTLQENDITARQNDAAERVSHDLDKEFSFRAATSTENLKILLKNIIIENAIARTGYIYITDDKGMLLAHSQREVTDSVDLSSTPIVGSKLFEGTIKTEGPPQYTSYWGEPVVGFGVMKNIAGLNRKLGIFVELPAADADATFVALVTQFVAWALLALFVTAAASLYLTYKIVSPIKELQSGTKRIAEEKFDEPVKIKTGDEMEDLGEAFNTMMGGLKELKELREEFIFVAAHELRTPVTAIKGFIQLVLEDQAAATTGTNKEYLQKAIAANERLITLVNDLLEVAREEAGRLEIKVSPVNISQPIKQIIVELSPLAKEKNIEVTYNPGDLPLVLADNQRISEVVTNLVGNSIKYMGGAGTITISHEISASGGKGGKLITHIADTGTGISKEAQGKLFEKFYRVYNEKTKEVKGTGLGLFIVKKIIEKMNGKIWVDSPTLPNGGGTTFSFELPIAR